ncbi:MAG: hypothetical protein IIY00_00705 [Clostridia bacterium]|nr:hypothetical protein [Clostridia bacterium]
MNTLLRKLTSRKFLLAVIGVVAGISMAFGVESGEIIGAVTTVGSIIAYITGEAKVDAAAADRSQSGD